MYSSPRSLHQRKVDEFMLRAQQQVPLEPTIPSLKIRELRARLILEEAIETINALGFRLNIYPDLIDDARYINLTEIADGCCDLMVVTTGTLSACGLADEILQEIVDTDNLKKFKSGYTISEHGKLIKPPDHVGPAELLSIEISNQTYRWQNGYSTI